MKNIICALLLAVVASPVYAISSSVIKNTTNTTVFSIDYVSGVATVSVAGGVVSAADITATDDLTVTDDLNVSGLATVAETLAVTGLVSVGVGVDAIGAVDLDYGSPDVLDHTFTSDGGTVILDGTISATGPTNNVGSVTVVGGEANDAKLVLDADEGDDNEDTWIIESEVDNELSFVNHTTEAMKISSAGAVTVTDDLTVSGDLVTIGATQITFSAAAEVTAATNTASYAIPVRVNGTNYYINVFPN